MGGGGRGNGGGGGALERGAGENKGIGKNTVQGSTGPVSPLSMTSQVVVGCVDVGVGADVGVGWCRRVGLGVVGGIS